MLNEFLAKIESEAKARAKAIEDEAETEAKALYDEYLASQEETLQKKNRKIEDASRQRRSGAKMKYNLACKNAELVARRQMLDEVFDEFSKDLSEEQKKELGLMRVHLEPKVASVLFQS